MSITITKEQRGLVLAALYNNALRVGGTASLHFKAGGISAPDAQEIIDRELADFPDIPLRFDYLQGRALKMRLPVGEPLDFHLYDRDNGEGSGESAVRRALETGDVSCLTSVSAHSRDEMDMVEIQLELAHTYGLLHRLIYLLPIVEETPGLKRYIPGGKELPTPAEMLDLVYERMKANSALATKLHDKRRCS